MSAFAKDLEAAIPALRRYARALTRDAEIADDLVQDTLVRALRSQHLFHGGDMRSWLYTILTNLNRNRLRALARRPAFLALEENDAADMSGPQAGARDIERALASLVEEQRAALLLVVLEGLSYREVAEVQGVPIGTVMSRLARARAQIKACLDGARPALSPLGDADAPQMAGPEAGGRDIERALAALVEDQRAALLLVVLEGLSYREVAEAQGVPIGTVMSRLARARAQIKSYLDGERPALRRIK